MVCNVKGIRNDCRKLICLSFFIVAIQIHILLRFLALCLCLQHLDDDLLLLNQESTLDPEEKTKTV